MKKADIDGNEEILEIRKYLQPDQITIYSCSNIFVGKTPNDSIIN